MIHYDELEAKAKIGLYNSTVKLKVVRIAVWLVLVSLILLCVAVAVYVFRLQR